MRQYYSAECTMNPIWLLQEKMPLGIWETKDVFSSREEAEELVRLEPYRYPGNTHRVYAIAIKNDQKLANAMRSIRPDLTSKWDDAPDRGSVITGGGFTGQEPL